MNPTPPGPVLCRCPVAIQSTVLLTAATGSCSDSSLGPIAEFIYPILSTNKQSPLKLSGGRCSRGGDAAVFFRRIQTRGERETLRPANVRAHSMCARQSVSSSPIHHLRGTTSFPDTLHGLRPQPPAASPMLSFFKRYHIPCIPTCLRLLVHLPACAQVDYLASLNVSLGKERRRQILADILVWAEVTQQHYDASTRRFVLEPNQHDESFLRIGGFLKEAMEEQELL
ncbi:uncharacterized protein HaLaN_18707 [Haematococcus lacustris]|uniref:Uncharacterized protein n=1 Tax=Haematococcus lacustris TaxID=44745 RepID=A0A699ZRM1_HAELA|nr:uncharacterized protein HaLaN_18707 [Haematococcus lacustris]